MASPIISAEGTLSTQTTTGSSLTVTLPAHVAGDILVCTLSVWSPDTAANIDAIPSLAGWTKQSDIPITVAGLDGRMGFFWRRATSNAETNPVFTPGANWIITTTGLFAGRAYTISGCAATGDPWDDFQPSTPQFGANPPFNALTVSGIERLAVQFFVSDDNNAVGGLITGWTANTGVNTTVQSDAGFQSLYQSNVSTNTSSGTSNHAANNTGMHMFFGVSFKPVGSSALDTNVARDIRMSGTAATLSTIPITILLSPNSSSGSRDTQIRGQSINSTSRDIRIASNSSNTTRDLRIQGTATSLTTRDVLISGTAPITSAARDIAIFGGTGSTSTLPVTILLGTSVNATRDLRITGAGLSQSVTRDIRISGFIFTSTSVANDIRITGGAATMRRGRVS